MESEPSVVKTEKDYEELLRLFNKHKVKYCVVGAYALGFHAIPRYTKDMDIFVETSPENSKKILSALCEFGFSALGLTEKDFSCAGRTVQLGYEPIRIDLLTSIDGCTFETVWKNKKMGFYGKEKVFFMGVSDLIKNKKTVGRKQDLADIEILTNLRRKKRFT